jgi:hypothetical protein
MNNQLGLLPLADQQLLASLAAHPDPVEAARRQRLFSGDLTDFGDSCERADEAMAALLTPVVGGDLDRRDRLVLLCVWGTIRDQDVDYFAPLEAAAPAQPSSPAAVRPAAAEVTHTLPPQPIRPANAVPAAMAPPPTPVLRAPCAGAAIEFLRAVLAAGERESREVQVEARKLRLTPAMIRAARQRLGIVSEKRGFGSECRSHWRLPLVTTDVQCSSHQPARTGTDRNRSESRAVPVETHSVQHIGGRARCADHARTGTEGQHES